jgi:hypothetical protein
MNLYSAFENNPARYRDPSGEFIVVPLIGFALGGIIDFGIQLIQTRGFTTGNYDPVRGFLAGSAGAIRRSVRSVCNGAGIRRDSNSLDDSGRRRSNRNRARSATIAFRRKEF